MRVERLILDRLSWTGNVEYDDLLKSSLIIRKCPIRISSGGAFLKSAVVPVGDSNALIQWDGNYSNLKGKYRVEVNPSKVMPERMVPGWGDDFLEVMDHFGKWGGDKESINVTRLDFAIDFGYNVDTLDISYNRGVERDIRIGRDGKLETMYWGKNSSDRRIRVYDKAKERGDNSGNPWTRVESQCRGSWGLEVIKNVRLDAWGELAVNRKKYRDKQIDFDNLVEGKAGSDYVENMAMLEFLQNNPGMGGYLTRTKKNKLKEFRSAELVPVPIVEILDRDYQVEIIDRISNILKLNG